VAYLPTTIGVAAGLWPFTNDADGLINVWRDFIRDALWQGTVPLWNPHLYTGLPLMSNGQAAIFYPPNIVYWTLPMAWALLVDALAHNIFFAFGAYTLARSLRLSQTSALVVAIAMALGSGVASHVSVGHMTWHAARAYIPWELSALLLYLRSGRRRYAVCLALLFAFQSGAGYPPMVLLAAGLCIGLLIAWTSVRLQRRWRGGTSRQIMPRGWIGAVLLTIWLAAVLGAVNVLPLRETSRMSPHGAGLTFEDAVQMSGSWHSLLRLAIPEFFGGNRVPQWSVTFNAHEEAAYVGLLTLVLALGAPWFARRREPGTSTTYLPVAVPWLWALLPVFALLAMGENTPVYRWLFDHFAVLRLMRVPVRWLEVWALSSALLAGFSFEGCIRRAFDKEGNATPGFAMLRWLQMASYGAVGFLLLLLVTVAAIPAQGKFWMETAQWNYTFPLEPARRLVRAANFRGIALEETFLALIIATIAAVLVTMWRRAPGSERRQRMTIFLVTLIAVDLLVVFWRSGTMVPRTILVNQPWPKPILAHYKPGERWDTNMYPMAINGAITHRIDLINGYDALASTRFYRFAGHVEGEEFWNDAYQVKKYSKLLRVTGLTHTVFKEWMGAEKARASNIVAQDGPWNLRRHKGAWPRVYLSRRLERIADERQLDRLDALAKGDFTQLGQPAVVHTGEFTEVRNTPVTGGDKVVKWKRGLNEMHIEAVATAPSLLVQSEAMLPGWRAWVNGKPAKMAYANFLFRGVEVPAGKSQVHVVYDNQTFRFSFFLSLLGLGMSSAIGFVFVQRHRVGQKTERL